MQMHLIVTLIFIEPKYFLNTNSVHQLSKFQHQSSHQNVITNIKINFFKSLAMLFVGEIICSKNTWAKPIGSAQQDQTQFIWPFVISKNTYIRVYKDRLLSHQIWDKVPNSMASAEEVVSYPVWTLLPNSNSMKIRLKTMWSRTQTPNQIMLQVF
jgi:hypothetical protein